jgi:hypothetical protein
VPTDNFPNTAWPGDIDAIQNRTDAVDIVYDDDFDYQDEQSRTIEAWLGSVTTGQIIGDNGNAADGPSGLASPITDGGGNAAIILAAKTAFAADDILSVGDNHTAAYVEKMSLNPTGLLWTLGGVDAGAMLIIPDSALPAFGTAGRLHWDPATPGLKFDDGAAWLDVGATAGSYLEFSNNHTETQSGAPVESTVGQGVLDGGLVSGSLTPYFRCVVTPTMTPGTVSVRLYDLGPKAGPPVAPTLITTLTASSNGLQVLEQSLAIAGAPGGNTIQNTARMYEVTIEVNALSTEFAFLGIAGIEVR